MSASKCLFLYKLVQIGTVLLDRVTIFRTSERNCKVFLSLSIDPTASLEHPPVPNPEPNLHNNPPIPIPISNPEPNPEYA